MAEDLTIPANSVRELDDAAAEELPGARETLTLTTFADFAAHEFLTEDEVGHLVSAASQVTRDALTDVSTYRPPRFVPGVGTPDLGRYPRLLAAAPGIMQPKLDLFWRAARVIQPVGGDLHLTPATKFKNPIDISRWLFRDVTVDANAVMRFTDRDNQLWCGALLIRSGARIEVTGMSLTINASSIQGE